MTKEEKLLIETRNKMQRLYEYSFFNHGVFEDGEQNDPMAGGAPGADPMAGGAPGADPMAGGDPNAMGGDPMAGGAPGADPMAGGDPNAMGGDPMAGGAPGADPMAGGDPNAMGADPTGQDSLAPNAGMDGDPNAMVADPNADPMGGDMGAQPVPDDDVVDITQLTDAQDELQAAQEETAEQLQGVDDKLTTLMQVVDKFTKALDANDQKINDLKQELVEEELQLEEETMNVRLNAGGNPFDQKPEEFWDKFKDINNHYNITANNDAPQYQIKGDIDSINDKIVNDEFDDFDDIPHSLHEYFVR